MTVQDNLKKLIVGPDVPVIDAIAILSQGGHQIVLVVDHAGRLLGVVTDYDVRQAILRHVELNSPVSEIMHVDAVVGSANASAEEIVETMRTQRVHQLPLVDDDGKLTNIHFDDEFMRLDAGTVDSLVVIMAGGLGSRLRPMTAETPKPLLQVGGRPILFILLDQLLTEGFERIFVTVNYKNEMIVNAIGQVEKYRNHVDIITEDRALGTAGSLSLLPEKPVRPFCVLNADLLTNVSLREMLRYHAREKNAITVATKREKGIIPYGVADLEGSRIVKLQEKPSYAYFVNAGVYIVDPDVLQAIPGDTFMDMPEVVNRMLEHDERVGSFPVHEYWLDIGNREHYERAQEDYTEHFTSSDDD